MLRPALKPLARIALTFAIVWFYQGLTDAYVDGVAQAAVVVALAIPTWVVVGRAVFPRDDVRDGDRAGSGGSSPDRDGRGGSESVDRDGLVGKGGDPGTAGDGPGRGRRE